MKKYSKLEKLRRKRRYQEMALAGRNMMSMVGERHRDLSDFRVIIRAMHVSKRLAKAAEAATASIVKVTQAFEKLGQAAGQIKLND